jgi:prepilin-type N-terminal cleavage/methylation domain-containing protein
MRRRAFTLVEMLVVIAVLVVLVGLLFPAIAKIQAEAQSTGCINNLRQISAGIETYRQQYQSLLPNAEPLPAVAEGGPIGGLPDVLKSFIARESNVWLCPSDQDPESYETGTSYLYLPGLYILTPQVQLQLPPNVFTLKPRERRELESRIVTAFYQGQSGIGVPMMMDSQDRHFIGDRVPRNALYFDGSIRAAVKAAPQQAVD